MQIMSEVHQCRLCVKSCSDYKNLYNENGYQNEVYEVSVNYFHPMILNEEEGYRHAVLCLQCWSYIHEFHNFRESVLRTHVELLENRKQFDDDRDEVECISLADSDSIADRKEDVAHLISDDSESSEEFEEPIGFFTGGSFNNDFEDYDISMSELATHDVEISSGNECSLESKNVNKSIANDSGSKTEMKKNLHLPTELAAKSCNISDTNNTPTGGSNEVSPDNMSENLDVRNARLALAKKKTNKRRKNRSKCKLNTFKKMKSNNENSCEKRTIKESDELIAQWLPTLECVECRETYSTFTLLKDHFRQNHRNKPFFVVCCQRKYGYRCLVEEHISLHLDPDSFKCKLCGRCFSSRANLCSHGSAPCSPQYNTKRRKSYRDKDDVIAKWKPNLECVICHESFASFTLLKLHFREKHRNDRFYVVCCQRKFTYRHQMEEHVRLHLNPQANKCEACDKCFTRKYHLALHNKKCTKKLS